MTNMNNATPAELFVGVHVIDAPAAADREYTYFVPADLAQSETITEGCFVSVPFGAGNRNRLALVTSVHNTTELERRSIKPVFAVCSERIRLSPELLGVFRFVKNGTLATTSDVVHAMIPSAALSRLVESYSVTEKELSPRAEIDATALLVYEYLLSRDFVGADTLRAKFGKHTKTALATLLRRKLICRQLTLKESGEKTASQYSLAMPRDYIATVIDGSCKDMRKITAAGQLAALTALCESIAPMSEDALRAIDGVKKPHLNALVKKGLIREDKRRVHRDLELLEGRFHVSDEKIKLSDEQNEAFCALRELTRGGEGCAALLQGVTGSGKTQVMLALIDEVLAEGKSAILLLPEIALTPQTTAIFCARYGEKVALLHSALSAGERYDAYLRIKEGEARLVIGTRSAVFAPVQELGLLIIDEEQEHTYKSDSSPRYHARDVARYRAWNEKALLLLCSATPSVESRKKAEDGAYKHFFLKKRYGDSVLPTVTVADMRREPQNGNLSPIGSILAEKLRACYERGEQAVLFLNRRGYNNYISCLSCGEAIKCPQCSVSMTYHTAKESYARGELVCHWCGRRMPVPSECPECHSHHLNRVGYGTQRVEEELSALLPDARILRMDTDTTSTKSAYDDLLGKFRRHEADILLGTQMVTKGHDFPDVTLVGVLLADSSLYYDDYRAAERTFSMLTQVIGRAGRRDKAGEAVIQTCNPDHEVIALAKAQDYESFYRRESRLRSNLVFPPYCDIALITATSRVETDLALAASNLAARLKTLSKSEEYIKEPIIAFGPFEAPVYRVDGKYRMRLVVKCRVNQNTRRLFTTLMNDFAKRGRESVSMSIDFNPTNL